MVNWKTKVGSLIMAFFLFAYVQYSRNITRVIQVRVEPPVLPANYVLNGPVPAFMNVRLSGPRDVMDFPVRDLTITLAGTKKKPDRGSNTFIASLQPELPTGVNASYGVKVPVELDFVRVRRLPVVPDFDLALDRGFERGYTHVEPTTIQVRGPSEIVGSMDRITTQRARLDARNRNVVEDTLLVDLPSYVTVLPGQPIEVKVRARVAPRSGEEALEQDPNLRQVDNLSIRCSNNPRGLSLVTYTAVTAWVRVLDPEEAEDLELEGRIYCPVYYDDKAEEIRPFREIQNVPVRLTTPDGPGFEVIALEPARIRARFERETAEPRRPRPQIKKGFEEHIFQP